MCGNRVEELESRVQELEASVEGLTDELVECKVRLRELESAVDADLGFVPKAAEKSAEAERSESEESPDTAEATKSKGTNEEDNTEETESDIIVA